MALKFAKKATAKPASPESGSEQVSEAKTKPAPKVDEPAKVKPVNVLSFMKKGSSAKAAMEHEDVKAEERKADQNRMRRFFLKQDSEGKITFLDGKIDEDGLLDIPMYYEHRVRLNGEWHNFACTAEADQTQPCPVCEKGDKSSLVGLMTIIDHSSYTVQKGPNAGKVYVNQRRLFVAKRNTIKLLGKLAVKRGGLAGCTFDVMRGGEKTPSVGEQFDFVDKVSKLSQLADQLGLKLEDVQPADYEEEVRYRTPEELIALGVGKATFGDHSGGSSGKGGGAGNLKDEL